MTQLTPAKAARLLFQLPRTCRVFTILRPEVQWGWPEVLANKTNFWLETLAWQNGFNPKKKSEHMAKKPKLFIPEFMAGLVPGGEINKDTVKHTVDDVKAILARPRK